MQTIKHFFLISSLIHRYKELAGCLMFSLQSVANLARLGAKVCSIFMDFH